MKECIFSSQCPVSRCQHMRDCPFILLACSSAHYMNIASFILIRCCVRKCMPSWACSWGVVYQCFIVQDTLRITGFTTSRVVCDTIAISLRGIWELEKWKTESKKCVPSILQQRRFCHSIPMPIFATLQVNKTVHTYIIAGVLGAQGAVVYLNNYWPILKQENLLNNQQIFLLVSLGQQWGRLDVLAQWYH